jgi:Uracil phosphoribosyltransferase
MASALPSNVHVSKHPCLRAKLSLLRSQSTGISKTKILVNDIATILGIEALAGLNVEPSGTVSLLKLNRPFPDADCKLTAAGCLTHRIRVHI